MVHEQTAVVIIYCLGRVQQITSGYLMGSQVRVSSLEKYDWKLVAT